MKKINRIVALAISVLALTPIIVVGATMKSGDAVSVAKGSDVTDNLYIAGGTVSAGSNVAGDLLAAGGNILVTGNVSQDMAIVGGSITILGTSGGDVRVVGGNIIINGNVAGDLIVTGGSVTVSSGVTVGKDLIIAGGQITVDGTVLGNARIYGGNATINGHIRGDLTVRVAESVTLGDSAIIDGNLSYEGNSADVLKKSGAALVNGKTVFTQIEVVNKADTKNFLFAAMGVYFSLKLLSLILVALILIWLFRGFSESVIKGAIENPLQMLGKGFVAVVVTPVAIILLFITILGAPLGIMGLLFYGILLLLSSIYAGVLTGVWLWKMLGKSDQGRITWSHVVGGTFLLTLIKLVPILGWIIGLLLIFVTMGSIVNGLHKKFLTQE